MSAANAHRPMPRPSAQRPSHSAKDIAQHKNNTCNGLRGFFMAVAKKLPSSVPMPMNEDTVPTASASPPVRARTVAGISPFPFMEAGKLTNAKKTINRSKAGCLCLRNRMPASAPPAFLYSTSVRWAGYAPTNAAQKPLR